MQLQSHLQSSFEAQSNRIPSVIENSPLYQCGGFGLLDKLLNATTLAQLQRESLALSSQAGENAVLETDQSAFEVNFGRGGSPARKFLSTQGGTFQDTFYQSVPLQAKLETLSQTRIKPTGARGTYSYYAREGDFLALHRDILQCDLTVITCLFDHTKGATISSGGILRLYPTYNLQQLSSVNAQSSSTDLRLEVGQSIALLGGIVPHELLPTTLGQIRVVSVLCFEIYQ